MDGTVVAVLHRPVPTAAAGDPAFLVLRLRAAGDHDTPLGFARKWAPTTRSGVGAKVPLRVACLPGRDLTGARPDNRSYGSVGPASPCAESRTAQERHCLSRPAARPCARKRPAGWGLLGRSWIARCSCGRESKERRRVNAEMDMTVHLSNSIREVDGVAIPGPEAWPPGITSASTSDDWERALLRQLRGEKVPPPAQLPGVSARRICGWLVRLSPYDVAAGQSRTYRVVVGQS
jgi:hypothetical protein